MNTDHFFTFNSPCSYWNNCFSITRKIDCYFCHSSLRPRSISSHIVHQLHEKFCRQLSERFSRNYTVRNVRAYRIEYFSLVSHDSFVMTDIRAKLLRNGNFCVYFVHWFERTIYFLLSRECFSFRNYTASCIDEYENLGHRRNRLWPTSRRYRDIPLKRLRKAITNQSAGLTYS